MRILPILTASVVLSATAADVPRLVVGQTAEGRLAAGRVASFQIAMAAGQLARATLDGDVTATVHEPGGAVSAVIEPLRDHPAAWTFSYRAGTAGAHRLDVRPRTADDATYWIRFDELRDATPDEELRLRAERVFLDAERLRGKGTGDALKQAIPLYDDARDAFAKLDDRRSLAEVLTRAGRAHDNLIDRKKARELYEQALTLHRAAGNTSSEGYTLNFLGLAEDYLGDRSAAATHFDQALEVARRLGNRRLEAITLNNLGIYFNNLGERRKGIEHYIQALDLNRIVGNQRGVAQTLTNVSIAYYYLGEYQAALSHLAEALPLRKEIGDHRETALTLNTVGVVQRALDRTPEARGTFEQALAEYRAAGDRNGEAAVLHNIASTYELEGEYQRAIALYEQALPLHRAAGYVAGEGNTLHNLARLYSVVGDLDEAADHYEQSLARQRAAANRSGAAAALAGIGLADVERGQAAESLPRLEQALTIAREVGDRPIQVSALNTLGRAYAVLGDAERSRKTYEEALELHRTLGSRRGELTALNGLASLARAGGDHERAIALHTSALTLSRQIRDVQGEAAALFGLAAAARDRGALADAQAHIESARAIVETLRSRLYAQELRATFLGGARDYYELEIDILMRRHAEDPSRGFDALALQASERARARALVDSLVEASIDVREGVDAALLERERDLRLLLNVKAERYLRLAAGKATSEQLVAAAAEVEAAARQHRDVQTEIRGRSPRYAMLTQPLPVSLSDIQRELDADTALIEFALGGDRSFAWVVTKDTLASAVLPPRATIDAAARRFYETVAANGDARAAGRALHDLLNVPPLETGIRRLVLVPDGALHYVPFGALPAGGATLLDSFVIVSAPSASTVAALRRDRPVASSADRAVAVFADPVFAEDDPRVKRSSTEAAAIRRPSGERDLVRRSAEDIGAANGVLPRLIGSRREADAIAAIAAKGATTALDFAATRESVTDPAVGRHRILHLATHGFLNNRHPELSGLVLSLVNDRGEPRDGFLRLHDIYNLRLSADLVVLSACRTALGRDIRGEGLIGLTRGFMYAGAPRVVASLWQVDDRATAELMKVFYEKLLGRERMAPAAALGAAQRAVAARPRWRSPYYWASFVLQGDWR